MVIGGGQNRVGRLSGWGGGGAEHPGFSTGIPEHKEKISRKGSEEGLDLADTRREAKKYSRGTRPQGSGQGKEGRKGG